MLVLVRSLRCVTKHTIKCTTYLKFQKQTLWPTSTSDILTNRGFATNAADEQPLDGKVAVKPFSEIPGPKGWPLIGTLLEQPTDQTKIQPLLLKRRADFGPIYKESLGNFSVVVISDPEAVENLFRLDGKTPKRFQFDIWLDYRRKKGEDFGVLTATGEQWHRMRTVINKPMMRIQDIAGYSVKVNDVITDFLERLVDIRDENQVVDGIETELFNWSLESIGTILYERRFGCLQANRDPEMERFIQSVVDIFDSIFKLFAYPPWFARLVKPAALRRQFAGWDEAFKVAKKCIDEKVTSLAARDGTGEDAGVLAYLLSHPEIEQSEIYANITELMIAAVDTTSNSMLWVLHEISRHPEVQEKLHAEVTSVLPSGEIPQYKDLQNLPYLRAVVKETLRKYPVAGTVARVTQADMDLCGYNIPKGTFVAVISYVMAYLPEFFAEPETFQPERWLRDEQLRSGAKVNPFTVLPFGHGIRMCIGRRVAEMELHLLLARLTQRFRLEPTSSDPVKIRVRMVLVPDVQLKIRFIERK